MGETKFFLTSNQAIGELTVVIRRLTEGYSIFSNGVTIGTLSATDLVKVFPSLDRWVESHG